MKKLPIGIQTFSEIISENYYYVDKTKIALRLIENGKYYFLSRPRRFGKSLFLDTLGEIFLGNKQLFSGLYIYDRYEFKPHPVIRISFGSGDYSVDESQTLDEIHQIIKRNERFLNIKCEDYNSYKSCFEELIIKSYEKYKEKVVILIDEYDKPIIDNITDPVRAKKERDRLKNFYSIIKDSDRYIRFVFITGVSKFSKLNLFSGLNNIEDITLNEDYAEICGYTHEDLVNVFSDRLNGINLDLIKKWYNGYNYFGKPLYNPYDILLCLSNKGEFRNYWWETGNPTFLIEMMKKDAEYIPVLENTLVSEELLNSFDIEYIDLRSLLWQTGYLTIKKKIINQVGMPIYEIGLPNLEVQISLNRLFADYLTNQRSERTKFEISLDECLQQGDVNKFVSVLKTIFATIPYTNYVNNVISKYEGFYSSVIFVYLMALGYDVIAEDITSKGRIDLTLKTNDKIYVIEFKVDSIEEPLKQIKEKRYYEKYLSENKNIYLIGINFNSSDKNIEKYQFENING